jgi:hypothetical protein
VLDDLLADPELFHATSQLGRRWASDPDSRERRLLLKYLDVLLEELYADDEDSPPQPRPSREPSHSNH